MIQESDYPEGMYPLVSVIIPTYNSGIYLKEAVESALDQDYPNLEIIVIDDGSTDESLDLLNPYLNRVHIVNSENYGAASARNLGIITSSGEYLAFLDSDDKWIANKISLQMKLMLGANLDLVYCAGQEFGLQGELGEIHVPIFEGNCYQYYKEYPSRDIVAIGPSGSVLKKSILHKSGIFDTKIPAPSEDWDFFRRYCKEARIGYCDEILVMYRRHSHNLSSISLDNYFKGNKRAIIKLFTADTEIGFFERRKIWLNFCILFAKSYLKQKRFDKVFKIIILAFSPILL